MRRVQTGLEWLVLLPLWRRWIQTPWKRWSAAGGVALVWLVAISIAVGGGDDSNDDESETVKAAETIGGTPETSDAVTPTAAPTLTREPTATREPNPTATPEPALPAFTAAECEYIDEVGSQASDLGDATGELGEVLGRDDIYSDEWILDVAVQLAVMDLVADEISTLSAPASLQHIQTNWSEVGGKVTTIVDLMTSGIDEFDASQIDQAATLMLDVSTDAPLITDQVRSLARMRSGDCSDL